MTKFGLPQLWSMAEVQVYLAKVEKEREAPSLHAYLLKRRFWGQKPYDITQETAQVENLA